LREYLNNIKIAAVSIFEGLAVTLSYCLRKPFTIQYPDRTEKPVPEMLPPGFRGLLEVDASICTVCMACQKRCPLGVIHIENERDPETKKNYLTRFEIDFAMCMVCGLCTEVCPTGAIRHSTEFEASTWHVSNLVHCYVKPGEKMPAYKVVKDQEPQGQAQNAPYRSVKKNWDAPAYTSPDAARGDVRWKKNKKEDAA
jgi:formate hydrogenlyase subunit 6/NADH:ubiquinone oxidoreductase subunit I